jgi:tetratricopeptide (TPR) repeat protein
MRKIFSLSILLNLVLFVNAGHCLNLDKVKTAYLEGSYKTAISEGEKILLTSVNRSGFDELYYYLGLAYFKDANYLRLLDMFGRALEEFKNSRLGAQTKLALGDTYFYLNDFAKAEGLYTELFSSSDQKLKPALLYRLGELYEKTGDKAKSKEYSDKLKQDFPFSPEARQDKRVSIVLIKKTPVETPAPAGSTYSVQVGAFSSQENASNLTLELAKKGHNSYIEEIVIDGKASYRVKVGRLNSEYEALELEKQLMQEGYPTKICP